MKTALITGASSGLGTALARQLSAEGWALILVARREDRLNALAAGLGTPCTVIAADLSKTDECRRLYEQTAGQPVDLLVNNAGFGLLGDFDTTDLDRELEMIDVNCKALHTLTKLYLPDMIARDEGRILNIASIAAYLVGPLMATYYATKAYVLRLSEAVNAELVQRKSRVRVAALCPGPFDTEFNAVAGAQFALRGKSAEYVARYALKKLFAGKTVINPGAGVKLARLGARLGPDALVARFCYKSQSSKRRPAEKQ